jgi:hypothetical protein
VRHPAFPLAAAIDQRPWPAVRSPGGHARLMARPPSGDHEERHLRSDISDFADVNPLHNLFADLQVQMSFKHDSHESVSSLQALLRLEHRQGSPFRLLVPVAEV